MVCEQCTQGYVLPDEPTGTLIDGAYFSPASGSPSIASNHDTATNNTETATDRHARQRVIVVLTDIFGLPLKNCKIIADELAKRVGCDVWVPDLFNGSPPVAVDELEPLVPDRPRQRASLWNKLKFWVLIFMRACRFYLVRAAVVDARTIEFVNKIRKEKGYTKVGAVGYCYGGSIAIRLGSTDLFDTAVIAHPGHTTMDEIRKIRIPTSWACAEDDFAFKKPLRDEAEASFAARKGKAEFIEYEFRDYKGTCHGFAARPNLAIPEVVEGYRGALEQTVTWFKKTLA